MNEMGGKVAKINDPHAAADGCCGDLKELAGTKSDAPIGAECDGCRVVHCRGAVYGFASERSRKRIEGDTLQRETCGGIRIARGRCMDSVADLVHARNGRRPLRPSGS